MGSTHTPNRSVFPAAECDQAGGCAVGELDQPDPETLPTCSATPSVVTPTEPLASAAADHFLLLHRFWTVVSSHVVVDVYPIFFASLQIALAERLNLTGWQIGVIYASNQITSGLPQGIAAWLADRHDTRLAGPLGLMLSASCACLIGFAPNFWVLWALLIVAMIGNGIYHPIAGAQAGQLGGKALAKGRALAVSIFFAAGMVGSVIGPLASTGINSAFGMKALIWLIPPGILTAIILHRVTGHVAHREANHHVVHAAIPPEEHRVRWLTVWMLFSGNAIRFIVNTGMFVLFNVWAANRIQSDQHAATSLNARLVVAMTIGMGVGAICSAWMIKPGSERRAILILSVLGAIFTALTSYAGNHWGMWYMYVCAALTSLGFASILPITIGLAQRLLPGRTSLASSLMLGVSWSIAAIAPWLASLFLGAPLNKAASISTDQIDWAFAAFGAMLLAAGGLAMFMPGWLVRKVGQHR